MNGPTKPEDIIDKLLPFTKHAYNCESLEPIWHKGPCDCGFSELVVQLRGRGYNIVDGSLYADVPQPPRLKPGLLENVADGRYWLGVCGEADKPGSVEFLRVEYADSGDRIVVFRRLSDGEEFHYTVPKR